MRALLGSFILAVCMIAGAFSAHADPFAPLPNRGFTLLVLYDKDSESAVKGLEKAFSEQTPFAQMRGWFHFKKHKMTDAYFAPCDDVGTTRLVVCKDAKLLNDYGRLLGGDRVIALTGRGDGGSGGEMAVMSTKGVNYKDKFIPGAIHEFLHQLGFADEYNYEGTFKDQMCQGNGFKVNENVVYQDFSAMFFENEESARILLRDKIPWIRYISPSVSILTNGHVGTPENKYPAGTLGLFRGGGCNLQTPGWVA